MAKLVLIHGQAEQRELLLRDAALLGRSPECDLVILGPLVSRQHARVVRDGEGYRIEDLGSANGTQVNGCDVGRGPLRDGDWIGVGDCQLTFLLDDSYVPPQPALLLDDSMPTVTDVLDLGARAAGEETLDASRAGKLRARLEVLKAVSQRACGALEIGQLVELALDELLRVYRQADHAHAVLLGFGEGHDDLRLSVTRAGRPPAHSGMSRTLLGLATEQQKAVLAGDVASDERLEGAQSLVGSNLRSIMCSPLLMGQAVLGAIQVDTSDPREAFVKDDLELLVAIAGQVAVAAENSRLHREVVAQQRLAAVGQAVSSLAHCIKNVLNSLQGGSYIVDLGLRDDNVDRVAQGWGIVKRNSGFMGELVQDMLAYCRKTAVRKEPRDLAELLNDTVLMVQDRAAQKGVRTLFTAEYIPQVPVDATGLKRVVLNLLTNAVEACEEGCAVEVSLGPEAGGARVRITVRDDGPGMPMEVREHIFEPFFTTKGSRGTGLGLALVHKVVEEHGGGVRVESEPGAGTAFYISLPVEADGSDAASA
jgi:signal transduction histidine kinase